MLLGQRPNLWQPSLLETVILLIQGWICKRSMLILKTIQNITRNLYTELKYKYLVEEFSIHIRRTLIRVQYFNGN